MLSTELLWLAARDCEVLVPIVGLKSALRAFAWTVGDIQILGVVLGAQKLYLALMVITAARLRRLSTGPRDVR